MTDGQFDVKESRLKGFGSPRGCRRPHAEHYPHENGSHPMRLEFLATAQGRKEKPKTARGGIRAALRCGSDPTLSRPGWFNPHLQGEPSAVMAMLVVLAAVPPAGTTTDEVATSIVTSAIVQSHLAAAVVLLVRPDPS